MIDTSQTALLSAAARAAHLTVDAEPRIFADTLATALLGGDADTYLAYHRAHGDHPVLAAARAQVTIRGRVTEDLLAAAVARGADQYVILGAGLDTFAYRSPLAGAVTTFEVDHPGTQASKRDRLAAAGIAEPPGVRYVPADFERDPFSTALVAAGFDPARPALVSWLGVTMYLTDDAIGATLGAIGGLATGTELVLDYILPPGYRDEAGQAHADQVSPVLAERGEPWRSFFAPGDMSALLTAAGFGASVTHLDQRESLPVEMWHRTDALCPMALLMIAHARVG